MGALPDRDVLLGIGDDGHTASLFPGTPVLDVKDRVAAEVFVPRLNAWRVTLTEPVPVPEPALLFTASSPPVTSVPPS